MADIWGPWIEHDGKGYPVPVGTVVEAVARGGMRAVATVLHANPACNAWDWKSCPHFPFLHIIRYRIRKPRGLTILQEIAADPQPVKESERVE